MIRSITIGLIILITCLPGCGVDRANDGYTRDAEHLQEIQIVFDYIGGGLYQEHYSIRPAAAAGR